MSTIPEIIETRKKTGDLQRDPIEGGFELFDIIDNDLADEVIKETNKITEQVDLSVFSDIAGSICEGKEVAQKDKNRFEDTRRDLQLVRSVHEVLGRVQMDDRYRKLGKIAGQLKDNDYSEDKAKKLNSHIGKITTFSHYGLSLLSKMIDPIEGADTAEPLDLLRAEQLDAFRRRLAVPGDFKEGAPMHIEELHSVRKGVRDVAYCYEVAATFVDPENTELLLSYAALRSIEKKLGSAYGYAKKMGEIAVIADQSTVEMLEAVQPVKPFIHSCFDSESKTSQKVEVDVRRALLVRPEDYGEGRDYIVVAPSGEESERCKKRCDVCVTVSRDTTGMLWAAYRNQGVAELVLENTNNIEPPLAKAWIKAESRGG